MIGACRCRCTRNLPISRVLPVRGGGKPRIVPDAEKDGSGRAALFDNERAVLIFHPTQQPSKIGAGMQGSDDDIVISARSQMAKAPGSVVAGAQLHVQRTNKRGSWLTRAPDFADYALEVCA